ncbi:unnamed protein product, partial [Porites evermanni]
MSCPCLDNREVKQMEKTQKYGPLMWELGERNPGHQVKQSNIIIDVLGGYSADVSQAVKELVGEKSATILQRMQRFTSRRRGWRSAGSCFEQRLVIESKTKPCFHTSGKSQTIRDFTFCRPSHILPIVS